MAYKKIFKAFSWITGISLGSSVLLILLILFGVTLFVRTDFFQDGLRDRLVQVARQQLGADINYESATISLFSFEPRVEFHKIRFVHKRTKVTADVDTLGAGISIFVSIPLLFVRTLHLSWVSIDGLHYELSSLRPIREWIDMLKPKHVFIPSTFQTTVKDLRFSNIQIETALPESEFYGQGLNGQVFLKSGEVSLESRGISFSGDLDIIKIKTKDYGPYSGNIRLEEGFHRNKTTNFGKIKLSYQDDEVDISGEVKNWENPVINLKGKGSFQIEHYVQESPLTGRISTSFELAGPIKQVTGKGFANLDNSTLRNQKWLALRTQWKVERSRIEVNTLEFEGSQNRSRFSLIYPFAPQEKSILTATFNEVDIKDYIGVISPVLHSWSGTASGTLKFEGHLGKEPTGGVEYDLKMKKLGINSYPSAHPIFESDEANIVGTLNILPKELVEVKARLNTGAGSFGLQGDWNSKRVKLNIVGSFAGGIVGYLFKKKLELRGSLRGSFEGPWKQPQLTVEPIFSIFSLNGSQVTDMTGQIVYANRILSGIPLNAKELSVYGGIFFNPKGESEFSNFRFLTRDMDPAFVFSIIGLEQPLVKSIKGKLTARGALRGPLARPIGSGSLTLRDWLFLKMVSRGRAASGKWATAGADIFFDDVSLKFSDEERSLVGEMSFDHSGLVDLSLESERVRFASIQDLQGLTLPVQAMTALTLDYQRDVPSLKVQSRMTKTIISGMGVSDSDISIEWIKDRAQINANIFGGAVNAKSSIVQTRNERQTSINLSLDQFNLASFSRSFALARMETPISGKGSISFKQKVGAGTLLQELFTTPGTYSGEISIPKAMVTRSGVVLHTLDPATIRLGSNGSTLPTWKFDKIILRSGDKSLQASGYFINLDDFQVQMDGQLDLRSWTGFYPSLSRSEGWLSVAGNLKSEGFHGKMQISDGLINFQNSPLYIRNVEALIDSQGSVAYLKKLKGDFREGTVSAEGKIELKSGKIEAADFSLNLQETLFQPVSGVSFRASGPLILKIKQDEGEVLGRLSVKDGSYRRRLDAKTNVLKFFQSSRLDFNIPDQNLEFWKLWRLNIDIHTQNPVNVRNNLVDGNINMQIHLAGTFQDPRLQGSMTIVNGVFYYMNRQFTVRSGSVQFTDPTSNIPIFDIRADTEIGDYRVYIRVLGSSDDQKISYSSDPTLSEKDILSLVVSGFRASVQTQDPTKSAYYSGISFVTGQFQDSIERGLSSGFGIRRFGLSPAFSETTKSTELQLTVGTDLIRNKLEVNYSNLLSTRGGHKVELELKMNRIISLIGSWRNIEGGTEQDFGGDLRFRFEFE